MFHRSLLPSWRYTPALHHGTFGQFSSFFTCLPVHERPQPLNWTPTSSHHLERIHVTCFFTPSIVHLFPLLVGTLPSSNTSSLFFVCPCSLLLFDSGLHLSTSLCPNRYRENPEHFRHQISVSPLAETTLMKSGPLLWASLHGLKSIPILIHFRHLQTLGIFIFHFFFAHVIHL